MIAIINLQNKKRSINTPLPDNTYTLDQSYKTSAGVYDDNGNLLRTLWSNVTQEAGTYTESTFDWDGLNDDGENVESIATHFKVVANNITATWEGVIGNTSDSFTGTTVHRHFLPFHDILIYDGDIYFTKDYTEAWGSVSKADLSTPNSRIDIMPGQTVQQTTNRIATDGVRLYMAGVKSFSPTITYVQAATFANLGDFNQYLSFQGATETIFGTTFKVTDVVTDSEEGRVTGLAVQTSGNWLIVARENTNSVHIVHKTTGVLAQTLTYTAPKLCKVDSSDNLWMVVNEVVTKYTINSGTGALTDSGFSISGFNTVMGLTLNADGSLISIADIDSNGDHRVKEYSTITGSLVSTFGRTENYAENPTVYNDKFLFKSESQADDQYIGMAYESDGSIWITDKGNDRALHFNSSKIYQNQIMYIPAFYSTSIDPNDVNRAFANFKEFEIDYSLTLQAGNGNNAWTYKNNWSESDVYNINDITTLSNSRTYGITSLGGGTYEFVELVDGVGLRKTGVTFTQWDFASLKKDGSVHRVDNISTSGTQTLHKRQITGFDGSNNPILASETVFTSFTIANNERAAGWAVSAGEITDNGIYALFNGSQQTGFHLMGIKASESNFKFKTSHGVVYDAEDPFPANGEYDLRAGVEYGGNKAIAIEDYIIWGYNGEFWENGQTNKYNMYDDSGLFLKQFGETSQAGLGLAISGMAGNAFDSQVIKYGGDLYFYHNDESYHAGLHRWKISNLSSKQEFNINITP